MNHLTATLSLGVRGGGIHASKARNSLASRLITTAFRCLGEVLRGMQMARRCAAKLGTGTQNGHLKLPRQILYRGWYGKVQSALARSRGSLVWPDFCRGFAEAVRTMP